MSIGVLIGGIEKVFTYAGGALIIGNFLLFIIGTYKYNRDKTTKDENQLYRDGENFKELHEMLAFIITALSFVVICCGLIAAIF